jgi:pimeloyl-ACP methyl ester carboxylesterase
MSDSTRQEFPTRDTEFSSSERANRERILAHRSHQKRNYVMIPGAYSGGWVWHPVAQRLRAAGHTALTLTMPGLGDGDDTAGVHLQDAINHIVTEVERRDLTDITLVAHSWGGYPTTGAAHRLADRVQKVVYVSAFVPTPGSCALDEFGPEMAARRQSGTAASSGGSSAPALDAVTALFYQDAPEEAQRLVWNLLTPQPLAYSEDKLDIPTIVPPGVEVAYILAENDQGLARPGAGIEFAARLGLTPVMVPGTHMTLLTHPDEVATAVLNS